MDDFTTVVSVVNPSDPNGSNNALKAKENNGLITDSHSQNSQILHLCDDDHQEPQNQKTKKEVNCDVSKCDKATPEKPNCMTSSGMDDTNHCYNEKNKKQGIFSSTPNMARKFQEDINNQSLDVVLSEFGLVSPLDVKCSKGKQNLKRKHLGLEPVDETDENPDIITEKKLKIDDEDVGLASIAPPEASTSSAIPCFEAPAKSLLKKWQPSCLSRNVSATTFIVLDECGETEFEDCPKFSQENDSSKVDDFEIACQSLTEELMKSSSNIETLEKYHSQVQLENQMDDEKFDEILKELTMNVDLDNNTCHSLRSMEESTGTINDFGESSHTVKEMEEPVDTTLTEIENNSKLDDDESGSDNNITVIEGKPQIPISDDASKDDRNDDGLKNELISETNENNDDNTVSELKAIDDKPITNDEELAENDEEDFLLEENIITKDKPYEFFEFVSSDPKENEDNYNPEWQKLGQLTSDEERYKAVRDRWRSLVPPDPNRNLTHRQWRARNNKPPIKLSPLNNNHQLVDDKEKNQLCTAVFDNKITKIVQELEDSRMNIFRQRTREFEELGQAQDAEQMRASMSGFGYHQMAQLHSSHLNQCRAVKNQYDRELKRITDITEDKLRILREASDEVLLFQKFYKGVGARDDADLYLTDIQVQELMETEEMLEQYKVFYK